MCARQKHHSIAPWVCVELFCGAGAQRSGSSVSRQPLGTTPQTSPLQRKKPLKTSRGFRFSTSPHCRQLYVDSSCAGQSLAPGFGWQIRLLLSGRVARCFSGGQVGSVDVPPIGIKSQQYMPPRSGFVWFHVGSVDVWSMYSPPPGLAFSYSAMTRW
jgi:hypothetical protein